MTFAGWPVSQSASSRFGTQHSQAIAAYAVLKEKFDDPGRGELAVDRDPLCDTGQAIVAQPER
ncbi:MAG TPA: hypothetical protein VFY56_00130 [Propionibacteriaceae bacterium]|nr:hypothetical protein [Propionibacteriaceae bacterium]